MFRMHQARDAQSSLGNRRVTGVRTLSLMYTSTHDHTKPSGFKFTRQCSQGSYTENSVLAVPGVCVQGSEEDLRMFWL